MLLQHEDLSLDPRRHIKATCSPAHICNPSTKRQRQIDASGDLASQSSQNNCSRLMKDTVSKLRSEASEMVQLVKVFATKCNYQSLNPRTDIKVGENQLPKLTSTMVCVQLDYIHIFHTHTKY